MANISTTNQKQTFNNSIDPERGKALTTADRIGAFAGGAGVQSGDDALTVLNRKLEAGSVLSIGSADPVFANETALFYHQTTSNTLFIRGSSSYTPITDENDFIGHGTNNIPATESAPWIYIRTDEHTFQIKEREGSPGSYTYFWQGSFVPGSYESRIVYSAQDNPGTPNISWNATNTNFNISNSGGADWAVDTPNPKWWRLISLPRDSNTAQISPNVPFGSQTAEQTPYTPPTISGNIPGSVDNVEEALNVFHNATLGGGGGTTQQPADWDAETGPTRILNKPEIPYELVQVEEDDSPAGVLAGIGTNATFNFNINQNLLDYSSKFNENIFIEAFAEITLQTGNAGTGNYTFDVRSGAGNTFTHAISSSISIVRISNQISGYLRASGNIPRGTTSLQLRVTVASGSDTTIFAGVDNFRAEIRPDVKADEVIISQGNLGNNISTTNLNTVSEFVEQVDELPIQFRKLGSEDDITLIAGTTNTFNIAIHQLIQDAIGSAVTNDYELRISYKTIPVAGSGGGARVDQAAWTFKLLQNNTATDLLVPPISEDDDSADGIQTHLHILTVPVSTSNIRGQFAIAQVNDADLNITDIEYSYREKIYGNAVTIDASGFNGNLATTDDTAQKVAQKFDDFTASAGAGGSTYSQRTTLNNINRAANTIETVDLVSEQITLSSRLIDEGGERLNNLEDNVNNSPNTPNTCLLYTSPSPRD